MTGVILAHIRAIRSGHSARARVEAVDAQGLEYKFEANADEVRGSVGDILVLSWTIHSNPVVVTTPTATPPPTAASTPASSPMDAATVDEQFDVLMRGAATRPAQNPEQQLAALLRGAGTKPG